MIAAAGDIACDPLTSSFNGGVGTANACHARRTSDLMLGAGLAAVLAARRQPVLLRRLRAFQQSYDRVVGPAARDHPPGRRQPRVPHVTGAGTGCDRGNAGAAGYFELLRRRARARPARATTATTSAPGT